MAENIEDLDALVQEEILPGAPQSETISLVVNIQPEEETLPLLKQEKIEITPSKTIGVASLALITFFITCGGPFGIEAAVGAAGPVYVVVGLLLVGKGFFLLFFFFFFFLFFFCFFCLSVRLFLIYMPESAQTIGIMIGVKAGLLLVSLAVNVVGPKAVSFVSLVLTVLMYVPFFCILGELGVSGELASVDFAAILGNIPSFGEVSWPVLLSTLVWALGGFDSVGALAAEVKGGKKEFIKGFLIPLPLSYINYIGPIFLCLIAVPDYTSPLWKTGGFPAIARADIFPPWVGIVTTAAAMLAMFGQAVAGIAYVSRQIWSCGVLGKFAFVLDSIFTKSFHSFVKAFSPKSLPILLLAKICEFIDLLPDLPRQSCLCLLCLS